MLSEQEREACSTSKSALLQGANSWVGDLRASFHFMNNETRSINICEGGIVGTGCAWWGHDS